MMAAGGAVTDRLVAYHAARAAGGAGLIVVQVAGVDDSARYTSHALMAHTDDCIPGYERLASVMHEHGCAAFGQLFHGGREVMDTEDGSLGVAYAPSTVPNERFRVLPRAMPTALVHRVIDGFGTAAARLQTAGMDGVEVVASHGYLPAQFLSPHANLRTDEFGGSEENRLRFLRMVLASIRDRTGGEIAVGLRVSMGEESHEGMTQDQVLQALGELDQAALLDYVSVVAGSSATLAGSDHIAPPMYYEAGYLAPLAAKVKAHVKVPVMVAGRVNAPQEAERLLENGQADAVGMTRAMICDPAMPGLAERGELETIRACIGCNQACIGHFQSGHPISCIQHPETGREQTYGIRMPAKRPRDVMVIGGGPGGLKAAAVAAERGHRVTLYESARRVGGQVLLAEQLPGRSEFGGAITNLHGEAQRAGVKIVTGVRVDAAFVREQAPDTVVVATGAVPRRPELDFTEDAVVVLNAWQVINGDTPPSGRVVVTDWRGDWVGLGVALLLAERGRAVSLATTGYQAGEALQQYVRDEMLKQTVRAGVEIVPLTRLYGADDDTVYLQNVLTGEPVLVPGASGVVLALGHLPVTQLADEVIAAGVCSEVHLVGDCLSPRTVEEAVLEGLQVGTAL
jgi:2,4-dienoyl-CoA reductase-like NADH-dependent reductase (Old Yellow Enzyme family)/thioredoxin reductase